MNTIWRLTATGVAAMVLLSCSESAPSAVAPEPIAAHSMSRPGLACDLTSTMTKDAERWFPDPERKDARAVMKKVSSACSAGDQAKVTKYATLLLLGMEMMVLQERGGDGQIGSRLANALLACTSGGGCTAAALPNLDLAGALSAPAGMFRVYTGKDDDPAVARATIPFTDFSGNSNAALFGVELSDGWSWTAANGGTHLVLVYGTPVVEDPLSLLEPGFGGLQYDIKRWPANGPFVSDDIVHVSVCFQSEVSLPHDDTGESPQPRMQRESTLLTQHLPEFCRSASSARQASLAGGFTAIARAVLPARLLAMFSHVRTPVVGGSALDFSRFAPVIAGTSGRLELVEGPKSVVHRGKSIGPIVVRAVSGGGTPIERVQVTLYLKRNKGVPAGAVLVGNTKGYTLEADGTVTIDGVTIAKPGGYVVCARGELSGFTFAETCSQLFHIRP